MSSFENPALGHAPSTQTSDLRAMAFDLQSYSSTFLGQEVQMTLIMTSLRHNNSMVFHKTVLHPSESYLSSILIFKMLNRARLRTPSIFKGTVLWKTTLEVDPSRFVLEIVPYPGQELDLIPVLIRPG